MTWVKCKKLGMMYIWRIWRIAYFAVSQAAGVIRVPGASSIITKRKCNAHCGFLEILWFTNTKPDNPSVFGAQQTHRFLAPWRTAHISFVFILPASSPPTVTTKDGESRVLDDATSDSKDRSRSVMSTLQSSQNNQSRAVLSKK